MLRVGAFFLYFHKNYTAYGPEKIPQERLVGRICIVFIIFYGVGGGGR